MAGKTSVFTVESVPGLIDGLTKFIGMQRIKKSVATWRNTMSRATPVEKMHHLGATFYWWPGFAQYWDSTKDGTPYTVATILLAKDALKVLEAETGMPATVKAKYAGALGDTGNAQTHFFEISMAHHFMGLGHRIKWFEDEGRGIGEFVVVTPTIEIEVECKHLSVDAGRQVTRKEFSQLCALIDAQLRTQRVMGNIHITLHKRLPKSADQLAGIATEIGSGQLMGTAEFAPWGRATLELSPANDVAINWEQSQTQIRQDMGPVGHAMLRAGRLNDQPVNPISMVLHSEKSDEFLMSMYDTMKDAAGRQLSGSRPGLLCIHLPEINDFPGLMDESGLKAVTSFFFSKEHNNHVCAISYSSDTKIVEDATGINFSADALAYKNALCRFPEAKGIKLFDVEYFPPELQPSELVQMQDFDTAQDNA